MSAWAFATMIVPAAQAPLARALAAALSPAGVGMFVVGLSADGDEPASHFISTGKISAEFAPLLQDAAALYAACSAAGAGVAEAQCQALVDASDVSEEPPFDALARLGLQLVQPDDEP